MILTFPKSTLGAVIDVVATPTPEGLVELDRLGRTSLRSASFKMLLDTGADRSALLEDVVTSFGLAYTGVSWTQTMNKTAPVYRYAVVLKLYDPARTASWTSSAMQVNARRDAFQGVPYSGVIGRDILDQALLVYNGPGHECALAF